MSQSSQLSINLRRVSRLEIPGGGQVVVQGNYAYVGHMNPPHGTTIIDVADPKQPKVVSTLNLPENFSQPGGLEYSAHRRAHREAPSRHQCCD